MSRRRAADGMPLDDTIPAPSTSSSKARVTGARFGRFIRERPLAAFLTFAACASFAALAIGVVYTLFSPTLHHEETLVTLQRDEDMQHTNDTTAAVAPDAEIGIARNSACVRKIAAGRFGAIAKTCVTDEYFMDLAIGETNIGRVIIGVFGEAVPKSAANFRALIMCEAPFNNERCFKDDSFHRIVPGFVIQGGSKATAHSIFGGTFREEVSAEHHSVLSHSESGVLAWAEYPIGSQFYIIVGREAKYLDNNHVVFGYVVNGMDVIHKIEHTKLDGEKPVERVSIVDCGKVKELKQ